MKYALSPRLLRLREIALRVPSNPVPSLLCVPVSPGNFHLRGKAWKDYLATMPIPFSADALMPGGIRIPKYEDLKFRDRNPELAALEQEIRAESERKRKKTGSPRTDPWFEGGYLMGGGNHTVPGYAEIIREGFPARIDRIKKRISVESDPVRLDFLAAMKTIAEGFLLYFRRCSETISLAAEKPENADRAAELRMLASAYAAVAERAPESFRETLAVYDAVFFFINDSPGCMDRYLYPAYRRDLERGEIVESSAFEYLCAEFIRFFEARGKEHPWSGVTHMALGGRNADGSSAVNAITELCLDAAETLSLIRPQIALRWFRNAPPGYLRRGMKLLRENHVSPDFSNDEIYIPSLVRAGIAPDDAANYSPSGCNEVMIPGKSQMGALQGHFNVLKLLNILFGQTPPLPGMKVRPLSELDTYEKFREEVRTLLKVLIRHIHRTAERIDRERAGTDHLLSVSLFTEDCIARGKSVAAKGARYNGCNYDANGIVNLADSLMAVRRLVYEEKRLTLEQFAEILKHNWKGAETLRKEIRGKLPHFGNGNPEADAMAAQVLHEIAAEFKSGVPWRGGAYNLGTLGGYENAHVTLAQKTGATPDGRFDCEAFASGLSPTAGFDREGPTSMLNSVLALPLGELCTSTIVNLTLSSSWLATDDGIQKAACLIETYLEHGGIQIQITVADKALLLEAEKNPEQFPDLMVRVSGYSARFFSLDPEVRAEIVRRTCY